MNCEEHEETDRLSTPKRTLSLFDSTCLIVGIIIGAGIFETAPTIAAAGGSATGMFALWIVGGLLSLAGALCYAELATTYPREGGDYVYLTRAYGPWAGFLFGWIQLVIARPGDITLMAFIFATYAMTLVGPIVPDGLAGHELALKLGLASAAVVALTLINVLGVRHGKRTQNVLTVVKVLGLVAIFAVAFATEGPGDAPRLLSASERRPLALALILVLFTYGGWNEMAYVAAEVKRPKHNILRALVLGTVAVTVLYLAVNAAFLHALGLEGMARSGAVGVDVINTVLPQWGGRLLAALVCVSALGAMNGQIFAGARVSYALGTEHRPFGWLGLWNSRTGTPVVALAVQAFLAVGLIVAFGSFEETILYTAAAVYSFYLATSLALIVLRRREPDVARPYRVTGYPVVPLVFAACCGFLIYKAFVYSPLWAGISAAILLAGLPIYWLSTYVEGKGLGTRD
ncbi:MAG: amino acid permease [Pirellulales bacterium]|nr:amino acid permease [Pirellulales bacterium]